MLAAIALCVCTGVIVKRSQLKYLWVTGVPLLWLAMVTTTAAWQKIFSDEPRIGFLAAANAMADKLAAGTLPAAQIPVAPNLIFNQRLDAMLAGFFAVLLWIIILDTLRVCYRVVNGKSVLPLSETPYVAVQAK
jgi:carbon starvation protein